MCRRLLLNINPCSLGADSVEETLKMKGFAKLLEGIVKYSLNQKAQTLFQLQVIGANPDPLSLMFACMDSRVVSSKYTSSEVGDNYLVKNAGNFVPYPENFEVAATTAAGALELTCVRNHIRHVVVTGHSDCKAMQLLYDLRNVLDVKTGSPLEIWIKKHGKASVTKFNLLKEENQFKGPITFLENSVLDPVTLEIDPENIFGMVDKLSQINCVQQLENIAVYPFLKERLASRDLLLHALWYDVYSGKVFIMSPLQQRFVEVNEQSYFKILQEVKH